MGWFDSFGIWRRKKPEMLEVPQALLVPDFSASSDDFYNAIEAELTEREVPDLEISRELFSEGGLLSSKREYLRMRRERLIFDVCAAPFGTSFFFSVRFAEIPVLLYLWQLLLVLGLIAGVGFLYIKIMGTFWGALMFGLNVVSVFVLLRNLVTLRLHRLDDFLMQLPVFGVVYETCFRAETYFREDTRRMYISTVKNIVQHHIEVTTGQKGIQLQDIDGFQPRELKHLAAALKRWTK